MCRELRQWCAAPAGRTASVWGQGFSLDVFQALLLNGMMGHALELDDVHTGSKSHVGAVVVETAWTLAEALGESGGRFIGSGDHRLRGHGPGWEWPWTWSATGNGDGTAQGLSAPSEPRAAAGHLLGLNEDQMVSALGMAGTQSSGLWAFLEEGATCKSRTRSPGGGERFDGRRAGKGRHDRAGADSGRPGRGLYRAVADSFDMKIW